MTRVEQAKQIPIMDIVNNNTCPRCGHRLEKGKTNRVACFKCGSKYSTIDFIMACKGLTSMESVNYLLNGFKPVENKKSYSEIKAQEQKQLLEQKKKQENKYNLLLKHSVLIHFKNYEKISSECTDYLMNRHIFRALCGLNSNVIEILANSYNGNHSIIYHFKNQKTMIQKFTKKAYDEKKNKHVKKVFNVGSVEPICHIGYPNKKSITIVEGIEDALTVHLFKGNFICLNSVSNVNKLKQMLLDEIEDIRDITFMLCLDNDDMGIKASNELKEFFISTGLKHQYSENYKTMVKHNIKDINDLLKKVKEKE